MAVALLIILFLFLAFIAGKMLHKHRKNLYWYLGSCVILVIAFSLFVLFLVNVFDQLGWHDQHTGALMFGIIFMYFVVVPVVYLSPVIAVVYWIRKSYVKKVKL